MTCVRRIRECTGAGASTRQSKTPVPLRCARPGGYPCNLMRQSIRWLDLGVIAVYLAGITWFGARFRTSQRSLKDYFLGGKTAPWWAIALSIVSAETSMLTVIGTPPLAFRGNYAFLQLVFGYLLARLVIVTFFLPAYFRGEMYTAYELMRVRFGER